MSCNFLRLILTAVSLAAIHVSGMNCMYPLTHWSALAYDVLGGCGGYETLNIQMECRMNLCWQWFGKKWGREGGVLCLCVCTQGLSSDTLLQHYLLSKAIKLISWVLKGVSSGNNGEILLICHQNHRNTLNLCRIGTFWIVLVCCESVLKRSLGRKIRERKREELCVCVCMSVC